jgi:hypothetical protein
MAQPVVCKGNCFQQEWEELDNGEEVMTEVSVDCPNPQPCALIACANYEICGNKQPQWLLDCKGGICIQPCDMMYAWIFEFYSFTPADQCPVCLDEEHSVSVKYTCGHMVCTKCFGSTVWDGAHDIMKRCPMCRHEGKPLGKPRRKFSS